MSTYPGAIDTTLNVVAGTTPVDAALVHSSRHNTEGSAIVAMETLLGTASASLAGILASFTATDKAAMRGALHVGATRIGIGTTALAQGQYLNYNGTEIVGSSVPTYESIGTLTFGATKYTLGTSALSSGNALVYNGTQVVGSATFVSPLTTAGDMMVHNGTSSIRKAVGNANNILVSTPGGVTADNLTWQSYAAPGRESLTDEPGGTITCSFASNVQWVKEIIFGTTAGTRVIAFTSGVAEGWPAVIKVKQNAGNTGTITWASSNIRFFDDGPPAAGSASYWKYFHFLYGTTDSKWDFQYSTKSLI